ncbi:phosphatase PAP2 family protein [Vibrio fluvialis]|jgi:undecaprenyl-diphosphatase|uniref:undecaprenyl-diphosphate phosphatase n=1 Tax=Vibrio fluvialis TaxID=676 RepID=A0AAX2LK17_VIBFL|nr:phosphatase PAP2 family protein [Vibrio fluvialis]TNF18120.1 MAG: phosphatase PAP2 family protein [Vibrionaceae bacterium]AMF93456.1 phosphatase PAP2 family protein [Vibrio fluvialis]AVH32075.1 phosphatase PAP2 family protein [Vibrio fluvialis]EKO3369555.1 phosphatase PAP2 family protein [Vibrio fluvialis]EKO3374270.1 phosphatase PAP2 family protein [Vibrio fluvialis]
MRAIEPIAKLDLAFSIFCLQHKFNQPIARVSKAVSHTGDGHLYALFGALAWWLDGQHGQYFLLAGLLAFAIELPIYWGLKNSFQRRRPQELSPLLTAFITPSDRYSLPSGHTAAAFVMATLIGQFYPEIYGLALMWAVLIGSARILLGVHFLTDVIIGAMLGTGCATLSLTLLEYMA